MIRTRTIVVEGEHANHLTTTKADLLLNTKMSDFVEKNLLLLGWRIAASVTRLFKLATHFLAKISHSYYEINVFLILTVVCYYFGQFLKNWA